MSLVDIAIRRPVVVNVGVWMFTFAVMFISFNGVIA